MCKADNLGVATTVKPTEAVSEAKTVVVKEETLIEKLITKDDPLHVHKVLGILCMISYVFRFSMYGESDLGFKTHPEWTLPTVLLHVLLNLSSYEFKIPNQRIKSGYRIWPQYRNHALAFLLRSWAYMLVNWYEQINNLPRNYFHVFLVFYIGLLGADVGTYSVAAKYRSGFARDLDVPFPVKFFFSSVQVFGFTFGLFGIPRYTLFFFSILVIQCNAFLMTLRRKNIGGHYTLITMYGVWVAMGYGMIMDETARYSSGWNAAAVIVLTGCIAVMCRLGPRLPVVRHIQDNKYLMWPIIAALVNWMRPDEVTDELPKPFNPTAVRVAALISLVSVFAVGVHKSKMEAKRVAQEAAAEKVVKSE